MVFAAGTVGQVAVVALVAVVLEDGQNAAAIQITVLDDLVNGEVLAKLGDGQELGLSLDGFLGQGADVVPGLALTSGGTLHSTAKLRQAYFHFKIKLIF